MEEKILIDLVQHGLSIRQIAENCGCSQTTIRWWLKKFSLKTSHKQFGQGGIKSHNCKYCGETDPAKFYGDRKECCRKCFGKAGTEIGKAKKRRAIEYMGGKCLRCGYDRYYGAFDFHHINRSEKEDWTSIRNWGWNRIVKELKKCILVCANCHREIHGEEDYGWNLPV